MTDTGTSPAAPIVSNTSYCNEMKKSLVDKIFFVDKTDAEIFIDFGCADGILLDFLSGIFPDHKYIGYDNNSNMIQKAKTLETIAEFTTDWKDVLKFMGWEEISTKGNTGQNIRYKAIDKTYKKTAIILSSVIHEVYSYSSKSEIKEFWNKVWNSGFDYVVIRDMMPSKAIVRPSDPLVAARIRQVISEEKIREWESQWGDLNGQWSLVHFLLTYRYEKNWKRELKENYFPTYVESLLSSIPVDYVPTYIDHYTLPFLKRVIKEDFGFDIQDATHLKLILEKKK